MMVVLKLPIVSLCLVVWWAVRAEPRELEPAEVAVPVVPEPPSSRPRARGRPHGRPQRGPGGRRARDRTGARR